jgi:hypothetical protein
LRCCSECRRRRLRCAACCGWCRRRGLCCGMLVGGDKGGCASALLLAVVGAKRWAALRHDVVDVGEGGCAAAHLLAEVGASTGGCAAAACCGRCGRRWLRCCMLWWVAAAGAAVSCSMQGLSSVSSRGYQRIGIWYKHCSCNATGPPIPMFLIYCPGAPLSPASTHPRHQPLCTVRSMHNYCRCSRHSRLAELQPYIQRCRFKRW